MMLQRVMVAGEDMLRSGVYISSLKFYCTFIRVPFDRLSSFDSSSNVLKFYII